MTTPFLVGWPGGSLESTLKLVGLLLASYALVLFLSALVWVYRDIRSRTRDQTSQVIAVLLVALFNLPGLMVYLVIRPQSIVSDSYERSLEAESIMHELQMAATSCQSCHRPIEDDFMVCPNCRSMLREPCRSCSRLVRTTWAACPYCAVERVVQRPVAPPARAAAVATETYTPSTPPPLQPPRRADMHANGNGNGASQTTAPVAPPPRQV